MSTLSSDGGQEGVTLQELAAAVARHGAGSADAGESCHHGRMASGGGGSATAAARSPVCHTLLRKGVDGTQPMQPASIALQQHHQHIKAIV